MDDKKRVTSHLSGIFYRNIALLEEGLKLVYVGIESGDDEVLKMINKGETFASTAEGLLKAKEAGIDTFLKKPINPSLLYNIIVGMFGEHIAKMNCILEKPSLKTQLSSLKGSGVLVVEDNVLNQEVLTGMLRPSGIFVDIASNGVEAVERFKAKRGFYELILMDIQMPMMDGYEAAKIIREMDKTIPIVALSANAMKEDANKSKSAGMNDHLNKPIDTEKLFEVLLKYLM